MPVQFSESAMREFNEVLGRYPQKQAALIPVLHLAQREFGHISLEVEKYVAEIMGLPVGVVYDTVSFYTMFFTETAGRHVIWVCHTLPCALMGAASLVDFLEERLGVKTGGTTADGKFTLKKAECLGCCDKAPVMLINDRRYENVTAERVEQILAELD